MEALKNNKNIKDLELLQQQINNDKSLIENRYISKVVNLQPLNVGTRKLVFFITFIKKNL